MNETVIVHKGSKWILFSKDGSKKLGEHASKEEAEAQERAIEAHKHADDIRVNRFDRGDLSPPEVLENGWIRADAFLSRTGVQVYRRGDSEWRELRLPEDVFNEDSLKSFHMVPVTLDHPPGGHLDAENTKLYQVGTAEAPQRDGDKTRAKLLITDASAVQAAKQGKAQISCGYSCQLDLTAGEYQGQRYDAIQRNIRGNHVALVSEGRAGPEVRLRVDNCSAEIVEVAKVKQKVVESTLQTEDQMEVTETTPAVTEPVRVKNIAKLAEKMAELQTARDEATKRADAASARADAAEAEVKKLQKEIAEVPARVKAELTARVTLEAKAKEFDVKCDGLSDREIKAAVISKALGLETKDKSADYVDASFDIALNAPKGSGLFDRKDSTAPIHTDGAPAGAPDLAASHAKFLAACSAAHNKRS